MRLKAPSLEINQADPFSTDKLERIEFGDALVELVKSVDGSFVLNLDASWGQGKTTFLQMWRHHLQNKSIDSLYFNAWETDFTADPLIALIGELSAAMAALNVSKSSKAGKQLAKVKKVGVALVRRAVPTAIKLATMGMLDLSELTEEALSDLSEKMAESQLESYKQGKESMLGFRVELEKFAVDLASQGPGDATPLVIIIDELDRCRPDYAIRVLETVKHLFSVPGVFFVIATDTRQLSNAVRHTYGLDVNADDYLRRFFDLALSLPVPDSTKFVSAQFERYGLDEFFSKRTHTELQYDRSQVELAFANLFQITGCSLRDQEKCFTLLALAIRTTAENNYLHPLLLCTLIVLRIKNFSLYSDFTRGSVGHEKVIDYFCGNQVGRKFFESDRGYGSVIEAYLIGSKISRHSSDAAVEIYKSQMEDQSATEKQRRRAERIISVLNDYNFRRSFGSISLILSKIELVVTSLKDMDD